MGTFAHGPQAPQSPYVDCYKVKYYSFRLKPETPDLNIARCDGRKLH
jgi:hypothetical protein